MVSYSSLCLLISLFLMCMEMCGGLSGPSNVQLMTWYRSRWLFLPGQESKRSQVFGGWAEPHYMDETPPPPQQLPSCAATTAPASPSSRLPWQPSSTPMSARTRDTIDLCTLWNLPGNLTIVWMESQPRKETKPKINLVTVQGGGSLVHEQSLCMHTVEHYVNCFL